MFSVSYQDYTIEVFNDPTYQQSSADNTNSYDFTYQDLSRIQNNLTSRHGLKVFKDGFHRSAILLAAAGATGVFSDSALVDKDNLLICCSNMIFSLQLPELELNWCKEVDMATCFAIYSYRDDYIVHGELSISRLTRDGTVVWETGARDIFVAHTEGNAFQMHRDHIELMDWSGYRYKLTYDGMISDYPIPR